jgi:hypothetical protein
MRNLAVECGGHLTKGAQAVTGPTLPELSAVMFSIKDFRIKYTVRAKLSHPGFDDGESPFAARDQRWAHLW